MTDVQTTDYEDYLAEIQLHEAETHHVLRMGQRVPRAIRSVSQRGPHTLR